MQETFDIPITYKGEDMLFKASLQPFGYTPKLEVEVDGSPIIFEQDEEGLYRAVTPFDADVQELQINVELLGLIAETLNL